jgi:hypothetical protein
MSAGRHPRIGIPWSVGSGDLYSDTFAYADGSISGQGSWTNGTNTIGVLSGAAYPTNTSGFVCVAYHSGVLNPNQYCWIEFEEGSHSLIGPVVRYNNGDGYALRITTGSVEVILFSGASEQAIGSSVSRTYINGDKIRLDVVGTSPNILLTAKQDTGSGWTNISGLVDLDGDTVIQVNSGVGGIFGRINNLPASTSVKASSWGAGNL